MAADFNSDNGLSEITSGENISYWTVSCDPLVYDSIEKDENTEVLVIGAGISGLTTAYCLAKSGKKVIVVDDGFVGSGESGRTTAHITYALDDRYYNLINLLGGKKAALAADSHIQALEFIEKTVKLENINCEFKRVDGYLFLSSNDTANNITEEYHATKTLGLMTEMLAEIPFISGEDSKWCIKFPQQGQFHILRYLKGLADAIIKMGGRIFTQARASEITKKGAKVNEYFVTAQHIVVATNAPINNMVTMHTKQYPYRTYVIAGKIPRGSVPYALWWDTGDKDSRWTKQPYHYVRLAEFDDEFDLLIAGGEDHKTGQDDDENKSAEERYERLFDWTNRRFPPLKEINFKWSGQVMEPVDDIAFIGKNPGDDNIYIITGDSGNGMTHGTFGGMLLHDIILGIKNEKEELYSPSRVTLKSGGEFLSDAANMAAQYVDWVKPGDISDAKELLPGQGGIISNGLTKTAVYRDDDNILHAYSAVCPHLGCIVHWNKDEQSFDCPCHGSRFSKEGKVMNGPALSDLKELHIKEQ